LFFVGAWATHLIPGSTDLTGKIFPFARLRELSRKALIWPIVFGAETALIRKIEKIPGFTGKTGNGD
jgi:hypothetical protein